MIELLTNILGEPVFITVLVISVLAVFVIAKTAIVVPVVR